VAKTTVQYSDSKQVGVILVRNVSAENGSTWNSPRASGVRSETRITGSRLTTPVRTWEQGPQLYQQPAESRRLALQLLLSPRIKVVGGLGAEPPAARTKRAPCCGAKRRSRLLLLTKYRIIETRISPVRSNLRDEADIVASGRCGGVHPTVFAGCFTE
jgi:hypothetical protein